jgi:hypothetical protein
MQGEFIKRFGEAYESRKKHSELAAFFYTDIGPLNQVIHVWPYESLEQRADVRADSMKDGNWPPPVGELIDDQQVEIFFPSPFTPTWATNVKGPVYEWRDYILKPGRIPSMYEGWGKAIEARTKLSPLAMAMHTEFGHLNRFVHVWAYESIEQRSQVRGEAAAKGLWPPPGGGDHLETQDNKICFPTAFSPAQ